MNYRFVFRGAIVLACAAGLALGQAQPAGGQAAPAGSPVAKQPQVKSQPEAQAVMAILQAQDPDSRIKASNELVQKFSDSEFKPLALFFAAVSYQQKGDADRMIVYAERALEADKEHYQAMLLLAGAIAQRTREHDLDREEKLKVAEGYANKALEILKTAPKPNPGLTDEQWEMAKKDFAAQAHESFAMAAWARNQNDKAIEEYKTVLSLSTEPEPSTYVRLAATYNRAGKYDDAIATLDKVLAASDLNPQVKKIAQAERDRAVQLKQKGAAPAP
ncbi:MAG: tetratricopeptide repeat protein [Bryobacterales bacterium]|jgi:tetratricopeptide (TPR) repeat protein|nr:tetratricopeptide repeat protein [Bryobacterales bacterium]